MDATRRAKGGGERRRRTSKPNGAMRRAARLESEEDLQGLGYYSSVVVGQRRVRNGLIVAALTALWYTTAIITITTTKEIMTRVKFPFLLSSIQFFFASFLSGLYLYATKSSATVPSPVATLVLLIALSYTFGFILTNSAFGIVTAAFAETIKSSEPISTVLLGLFFFNENVSTKTYLTLLPICLGIGISCYNNDSFDTLGFFFAAASNLCFSTRAVLAKKLTLTYPDSLDEINLFLSISVEGLAMLVPTMLLFESRSVYQFFSTDSIPAQPAFLGLGWLVVLNGCMFASYNLLSYLVLRRTDLITHSVLNAFRRVSIILFTAYYFRNTVTPLNSLGIAIAVVGVMLFAYFRTRDKTKQDE